MPSNKPYNPFLIAGYNSPAYFCDRETETSKMISALANDRNVSLLSPRRYGKTGLIRHVFHTITQADTDIVCIYLDLFPTQNLNDFVKLFAESALGKIDGKLETAIQKHEIFLSAKRPFYQSAQLMTLDVVSLEQYYQFASEHF